MNKKVIDGLDLTVYEEVIDSGLHVYIVPMKHINGIYATLSTKFGGDLEQFVPIDSDKMTKMPRGVAHFIEHQMFNCPDETDLFAFYSERGSSCNANTRNDKTTYLFSGVNFFEDNLNKLLDFVYEPYFTDESVEREKMIIKEEIDMYEDDPYTQMNYHAYANAFLNHPLKDPVIGNHESVESITKEHLYTCYKTFYQPSNMFLVVTGNVNPDEIINVVKENMSKKKFPKPHKIVTATYNEPDKVARKEEKLKLKVSIPKVTISYKINITKIKNLKKHEILSYLSFMFDAKIGVTSDFLEKLKEDKLVLDAFYISYIETDKHIVFSIQTETDKPDEVIARVLEEMKKDDITEEQLERRKRVLLSHQILGSENIYQVNLKIMNNLVRNGQILYNAYNDIKKMNLNQLKYVIKNISLENYSILYIEPETK